MLSLVAGFALVIATGQVGLSLDLPWSSGFTKDKVAQVDIITIVTIEGNERRQTRQELVSAGDGLPPKIPGNVATVRIATGRSSSGKGVHAGETLDLVTPTEEGVADRLSFKRGHRYLIFAFRQRDEHLTFPAPGPSSNNPVPDRGWSVQCGGKNEVATVMAFPTSDVKLQDNLATDDVLLDIVKSLDTADDDSFRRTVSALKFLGPALSTKPWDQNRNVEVQYAKPDKVCEALIKMLPRCSPYQRSKIWELLLRWLVPGSKVGYVRSLQKLADDPSVYQFGSTDQLYEDWDRSRHLEFFPEIRDSDWLNLVTGALNDTIAVFFLQNYGPLLKTSDQQRLATRLLDPNPQIRLGVAYQLSLMNKDVKHRPYFSYSPQEAAPLIQYWIEFYGIRGRDLNDRIQSKVGNPLIVRRLSASRKRW